jgi:SAM-dependent methyltransferase
MTPVHSHSDIIKFYSNRLNEFGNSPKGVGWKDDKAQYSRFEQLLKIVNTGNFSINDIGCGTGQFYNFLLEKKAIPTSYRGYDILEEMTRSAADNLKMYSNVSIKQIQSVLDIEQADFSIESGIFNVKYEAKESHWLAHILTTLETMNTKSRVGFAFNCLTKYSDKEFMQDYLYYADPLFLFDYCKRNFSKNIALLHDYDQYDFTILVRK